MSILVDENSKVCVQGITGREGMVRTQLMKDYGTDVVAGVTPGRGGGEVYGVPVFDSVQEAWEKTGPIDISVIFVPAALVKNAALESIAVGVKLLVLVPDRVPIFDVLEISYYAREKGASFVGPNTLGLVSPGKAVLGMIGGRAERAREWFRPGNIGVSSRSGGMTSAISYYLTEAGLGQSTIIHVGGDAVVGLSHPEVIEQGKFTKPAIAYVGGKAAKSGTRFSHAGAIVEGTRGSYDSKVKRLKDVGVHVVDSVSAIPQVALKLKKGGTG
jgi:succinyl-CoA synthetase alpha subunit